MATKRIVIIDDEFDIREFLTYNLAKEGYEVEAYSKAIEALWSIWGNPPDLLLTDWLMPDLDGLDVCLAIKTDFKTSHIPIIMITCRNSEADKLKAIDTGADDYLAKPFQMKELLARIDKQLNSNPHLN
jgi:two-component system phosphate regulon response regulator PhoB